MTSPSQVGRPWLDHKTVDGAYTGRLNALAVKVAETFDTEEQTPQRLGGARQSITLADEYDALLAEAEHTKRVMALPRRRWADLKAAHPPRKDDDGETLAEDEDLGVNAFTFFDAVMPESIIDPEGDLHEPSQAFTAAESGKWTDSLSNAEWNELCSVVWTLNERGVGVPKSSLASRLRQRIDADSKRHETSESPRPASTAGNRLAAASTTTPQGT